jgi:transposase
MGLYVGIDLHSSNNFIGISDEQDRRVFKKRIPNRMGMVRSSLEPFKKDIKGVVVESTFNWYWLVDGLMAEGYKVHLANPTAIQQYSGLKYTDDQWDSFWLAHLLRLGILPEGYIYPSDERPLRDLLRKRLHFVRQRTSLILSLKGMINRNTSLQVPGSLVKNMKEYYAESLLEHPHLVMSAHSSIAVIRVLSEQIRVIEVEVKSKLKLRTGFMCLLGVPGIGDILGMTIMLEVGDINRFGKVGNYASYCRCVNSKRLSNGKQKGKGNAKNGNKYLAWAYIEASNLCRRNCAHANRFYQRKLSKSKNVVAIKALSNKLARATYYMMRDQVAYNPERLFG